MPSFITRTLAVKVVACALVVLLAFFAGGVWGFAKGFVAGMYEHTDGFRDLMVLRHLREGKIDPAVELLESHLDGCILVYYGTCEDAYRSRLDLLVRHAKLGAWGDHARASFMADAAKYRERHPSQHPSEKLRQMIRSTLERYGAAAEHNPRMEADAPTPGEGDASDGE